LSTAKQEHQKFGAKWFHFKCHESKRYDSRILNRGEVAWVDAWEGLAEEGRGWEDREREVWEDEHPEKRVVVKLRALSAMRCRQRIGSMYLYI